MSTSLVEDGSVYPSSVTVPGDGDARNAASVIVGFQALADRCKYLYTKLGVWINGGTIRPSAAVTLNLQDANFLITGDDDYNVHLGGVSGSPGGVQFFAYGNMASQLFTAGRTGRANRKPNFNNAAASQTIDPILYDTFIFTPSAAGQTYTTTTQTYVEGDWFEISNQSATNTFQINAGGVITTVAVLSGVIPGTAVMVYASGSWRRIR